MPVFIVPAGDLVNIDPGPLTRKLVASWRTWMGWGGWAGCKAVMAPRYGASKALAGIVNPAPTPPFPVVLSKPLPATQPNGASALLFGCVAGVTGAGTIVPPGPDMFISE